MIELDDVQGNVLCGYGFAQAAHLICRVRDPEGARAWLRSLAPRVTSAAPWGATRPAATLNVAFSAAGLRALGMAGMERLPAEFLAGMAARAERLGDGGADAPGCWQEGLDDQACHILVTAHVDTAEPDALERAIERARPDASVHVLRVERAARLAAGREHFGWSDGLAQPSIDDPVAGPWNGQGTPDRGSWAPVAPGEFLLGHRDEDGELATGPAPLDRNATFMVVRKLEQHVAAWDRQLLRWADGDPARAARIGAQVVGRHRDGTPLADLRRKTPELRRNTQGGLTPSAVAALTPEERAARCAALNDFGFADDPGGARCPVGAHVRRANPRDALGDGRLTRRHRLIRRGMPYGPEATPEERADDSASPERGLFFVCFQASIARQFELVQGDWLADGDAFGLGAQRDVILSPGDPDGRMLAGGRLLAGHERTVTLRGGGYFVVPSLRGLCALAV